jgi:hypothetical protein
MAQRQAQIMAAMAAVALVLSVAETAQQTQLPIPAAVVVELLLVVMAMEEVVDPALSLFAIQHLLPQALMQFQRFLALLALVLR